MSLKVSRILHAGYIFESGATKIAFDTIFENPFSMNCYAYPNVIFDPIQIQELDLAAIFISHFHDDHCSLESLALIKRSTPIYLYCEHEELFSLVRQLGFHHVHKLRNNESIEIGEFRVTPKLALDPDVDSIFHIEADGLHILNMVDAWMDLSTLDELVKISWDLILWPFQTMREIQVISPHITDAASEKLPPEWIEQIKILNPKWIVPSSCQFIHESWSWLNVALFPISYRQFQEEVEIALRRACVVRMNPSTAITLDHRGIAPSAALSWAKPLGEQDVDYHFNPNAEATATSKISGFFPQLNQKQMQRVYDYCARDLLDRYSSLLPSEYFLEPHRWRLSVFDQDGTRQTFFYEIHGQQIRLIDEASFSWSTEIPAYKLFCALENGESLSSMYIRVIGGEDPFEDPLVRCLFENVFGTYQLDQLKRLKKDLKPVF